MDGETEHRRERERGNPEEEIMIRLVSASWWGLRVLGNPHAQVRVVFLYWNVSHRRSLLPCPWHV